MATLVKTPADTWKAVIRKRGWPTTVKTFRTKRDALDWARRTEDEIVRGVYVDRASAERLSVRGALERYLSEVSPTKRPSTARREGQAADVLIARLGDYSLAALSPDLVATYRDERLGEGKSPDTVRIELAAERGEPDTTTTALSSSRMEPSSRPSAQPLSSTCPCTYVR